MSNINIGKLQVVQYFPLFVILFLLSWFVAITADEANSLTGKNLVLSDSVFSFVDYYFYNPKVSIKKESTNENFPLYRRSAYEVGIETDSITIIKIENNNGNKNVYLINNNDTLIYSKDGWFFFLKKE